MPCKYKRKNIENLFLSIFEIKQNEEKISYVSQLCSIYEKKKNAKLQDKWIKDMIECFMLNMTLQEQVSKFSLVLERNNLIEHFDEIIQDKLKIEKSFDLEAIQNFISENGLELELFDKLGSIILDGKNYSKEKIMKQIKKVLDEQVYQELVVFIQKREKGSKKKYLKDFSIKKENKKKTSSSNNKKQVKIQEKEMDEQELIDSDSVIDSQNENDSNLSLSSYFSLSSNTEDYSDDPIKVDAHQIQSNSIEQDHDCDCGEDLSDLQDIDSNKEEQNLSDFQDQASQSSIQYKLKDQKHQQSNQLDPSQNNIVLVDKGQGRFQIKKQNEKSQLSLVSSSTLNSVQKVTDQQINNHDNYYQLEKQLNPIQKKLKSTQDQFYSEENLDEYFSLSPDQSFQENKKIFSLDYQQIQTKNMIYADLSQDSLSLDDLLSGDSSYPSDSESDLSIDQQTLIKIDTFIDNMMLNSSQQNKEVEGDFQKLIEIQQMLKNEDNQNDYLEMSKKIQDASNFIKNQSIKMIQQYLNTNFHSNQFTLQDKPRLQNGQILNQNLNFPYINENISSLNQNIYHHRIKEEEYIRQIQADSNSSFNQNMQKQGKNNSLNTQIENKANFFPENNMQIKNQQYQDISKFPLRQNNVKQLNFQQNQPYQMELKNPKQSQAYMINTDTEESSPYQNNNQKIAKSTQQENYIDNALQISEINHNHGQQLRKQQILSILESKKRDFSYQNFNGLKPILEIFRDVQMSQNLNI